ncbi:hypothetical protein H0W26_00480 [Candidatus Dependentiae bacterium]|nr:hypothetical protein [Candidatus Dependentiae bacterium]
MNPRQARLIFIITTLCMPYGEARSPWRPKDPFMPELHVRYAESKQVYSVRDYSLEYIPIFKKFDRDFFMNNLVSDKEVPYRTNASRCVKGSRLKKLCEEVIYEIRNHKTKPEQLKHFIILKSADFNFRTSSGLIILKYKRYPFVLKLFIKTAETFMKLSEGIIPKFLFRIGGGINRHLSGFTRVKNSHAIKELIQSSDQWKDSMDVPDKRFILPRCSRWLELRGRYIGPEQECCIEIPAIYGILCDWIKSKRTFSLSNADERTTALSFAQWTGNRVDANIDNFTIEESTGKIVIIDTEHFPTMVGLKDPFECKDYASWYTQLSVKFLKNSFLQDKNTRRELQTKILPERYPI